MSFFVVCAYPIHRVMVNWDPPISQVIHLPGAIQNYITSMVMMMMLKTMMGNSGPWPRDLFEAKYMYPVHYQVR